MTIDAVFFDFGGVILTSPFEAFAVYEQRAGLPVDTIRSINATNPDHNAWARFERNDVTIHEFISEFEEEARALGFDVSGAQVLECLDGSLRPEMVEVVRRCAAQMTTALLTNNVVTMAASGLGDDVTGSTHRFAEVLCHFDHIVESSVVGVRKPERRFYEIACERAGVEPERVVFLDDLGVNLKPARAMGMSTIKVVDVDRAIGELEMLIGLPLR